MVSIAPATTEALFAVGAGPLVVGRSRYCDFPEAARALPQVGGVVDPSFEAIVALTPTLVVGAEPSGNALERRLRERGVEGYFPATETMGQIDAMIEGVGVRAGRAEQGKAAAAAARAERERVARAVEGRARPRVVMVFGVAPITVAGPGSFADELLAIAGARNAIERRAASTPYPQLGLEQLIALDPDVVIDAARMDHPGTDGLGAGWSKVRAVREGRVVGLDGDAVLRPGPRIGEGVAQVARALHPGVTL